MLFFENLKLAITAIRVNKMRSFLTMLGMIIGISSVIAIVSIGDTMRGVISDEYKGIGLGTAMIYITSDDGYYSGAETFTYDEMEKIKKVFPDEIGYIGAASGNSGDLINGRKTVSASFTGMAENPRFIKDLKIVNGRMLSNKEIREGKQFIMIEDKTAMTLYGKTNVIGKTIRTTLGGKAQEFLITGVYENTDSTIMKMMNGGSRAQVYVPELALMTKSDPVWNLRISTNEDVNVEAFKSKFIDYIAKIKNKGAENIVYYSAVEELAMMDGMMQKLSLAVGAIAAISLLVGGIGIMNIMLVSVTERTREIGIRKALGARTGDVLVQFLIESAIISAAGGIIGTILGAGTVMIGGSLINIAVVVKPQVVFLAVAFSAIVGIFFGIYPARKAAKQDPITALRYE